MFVHLDLDVLDPEHFPAAVPAPGGLHPGKAPRPARLGTRGQRRLVGLEVTAFEAPEHEEERIAATETAMHVLEPFLDHLGAARVTERAPREHAHCPAAAALARRGSCTSDASRRSSGAEEKIARQHEPGRELTARERLALLIDEGTFTELGIHGEHFAHGPGWRQGGRRRTA